MAQVNNEFFRQAPRLFGKGAKTRDLTCGKAIRSHELESKIFCGLSGQCGAQLKLILFLTGNSNDGSFAVAEKTVCERCGFDVSTYKRARKELVKKGWIEHEQGRITVLYDAIYGYSFERNFED